jgi:hypothetical protein
VPVLLLCREADKLEQSEEDAKNGNMLSELGLDLHSNEVPEGLKDLGNLLNMKGGILGNQDTRAVFIVNAQCIIQVTNPVSSSWRGLLFMKG